MITLIKRHLSVAKWSMEINLKKPYTDTCPVELSSMLLLFCELVRVTPALTSAASRITSWTD